MPWSSFSILRPKNKIKQMLSEAGSNWLPEGSSAPSASEVKNPSSPHTPRQRLVVRVPRKRSNKRLHPVNGPMMDELYLRHRDVTKGLQTGVIKPLCYRENGPIVAVDRVTGSGCMDCQPRRYAGDGPKPLDSHLSQGPARCL